MREMEIRANDRIIIGANLGSPDDLFKIVR
jgi:hypothetical protein